MATFPEARGNTGPAGRLLQKGRRAGYEKYGLFWIQQLERNYGFLPSAKLDPSTSQPGDYSASSFLIYGR